MELFMSASMVSVLAASAGAAVDARGKSPQPRVIWRKAWRVEGEGMEDKDKDETNELCRS
ncbi:hypothetical protein [Cupriavidus numazuensis]|uniref:hypothetical protein n=1 Tax=Cupriavidus numazuensis TaxID=221992 RepID=UPI001BADE520|nr:hypothetical protein [Cupriavidus numazuensis]